MRTRLDKILVIGSIMALLGTAYVVLVSPPVNALLPTPDFINIQFRKVFLFFGFYYNLRINAFLDIWYLTLQAIYDVLVLLGYKKRRPFWGTVYDSASKQPLDPVIVTLRDAQTGEVVEQAITDIYGRFGFLMRKGVFTLEPQKKGYRFPSARRNRTGTTVRST